MFANDKCSKIWVATNNFMAHTSVSALVYRWCTEPGVWAAHKTLLLISGIHLNMPNFMT